MTVGYERHGPAALLTIERPERRNAVDGATAAALLERVRALLRGRRGARAGADRRGRGRVLRRRRPEGDGDARRRRAGAARWGSPGWPRPSPRSPPSAGWCLAGGLELALWCDLRIADATARLGFAERRWGVPLIDGGTQRIARVVGRGRALELVLTGRTVEAEEALRIGLVNEVVDAGPPRRARARAGGEIAAFPQDTMLSRPPRAAGGRGAAARPAGWRWRPRWGASGWPPRGRARSVSRHARATPESFRVSNCRPCTGSQSSPPSPSPSCCPPRPAPAPTTSTPARPRQAVRQQRLVDGRPRAAV